MTMLIYAAIAIAFLIVILGLFRKIRAQEPDEFLPGNHTAPNTGNVRWLDLSERIFDPSDARWLREELAFPRLAELLTIERKRLAIAWLEALQESFDALVRTPEVSLMEASESPSPGSWQMLWLTVRFKFLVSYALLVVRFFGPYHRLIPSFSWVPFPREIGRSFRQADLVGSRSVH
jgi:hypothetical protein